MTDTSYRVHLGIWTNWSYGPVLGKTLTVTRADGALIIAFVAFFVATVGSQLWRILCFSLHNLYSTSEAQDAVYNQRQAVLRNSGSPVSGFWELLQLVLAWNKKPTRSLARLLPPLLCAVLTACIMVTASGFSSRISLGNDVLLAGDQCGLTSNDNRTIEEWLQYIGPYHTQLLEAAADYAQRCYDRDSDAGCNTLMRKSLPITTNSHANCPFDDSLCLSADDNIYLDSGLLDSHVDLGINSPPSSRFQYRQTLHCAPLVTEGYKSNVTGTANRTYTRYMYGPWIVPDIRPNCNCSLAVPHDILQPEEKEFIETSSTGYKLDSTNAIYLNNSLMMHTSAFVPIDEFNRTDGHVQLFFLSANSIAFIQESQDLWYRAATPVRVRGIAANSNETTVARTLWQADEPAWPMGCMSQYQICNPSYPGGDKCTQLGSIYDAYEQTKRLFGGDPGFLMYWFMTILGQSTGVTDVTRLLGIKSLTSRFSLAGVDLQGPLEPNQWHLDVNSWFSITLAALQLRLVSTAAGPSRHDAGFLSVITRPKTEEQKRMCDNQIIRTTEYISFSVFGLSFILAFGGFVILVSFVMDPLANRISNYLNRNPYANIEWRATQKLHLQRLAHEGIGFGHWGNGFMDVPVTLPKESLAVLDAINPKVPRLVDSTCDSPGSLHGMGSSNNQQVSDEHASVRDKQAADTSRSCPDPESASIASIPNAMGNQSPISSFQIHSAETGSTVFVGAYQANLARISHESPVQHDDRVLEEERGVRNGANYI
ncbi:hypothetical protein B0I35DRAFT_445547 [Stachybotrys elegans]|uniref:Uncharacterized protein n=1 Tax=Stachybotrys elegans TaxID=80388 RepID=A0A8K0SHK0_9HYPO|nr:hypothetical protein B0I35DRAFT_445547 [Stachybotrys elegans]